MHTRGIGVLPHKRSSAQKGGELIRRLLALSAIVGVSLFAVPTAGAEVSGMAVEVGSPGTLVAGVYVVVPVTVTCVADEASIFSDSINVTLSQKNGRTLVQGSGGTGYQSPAFNGIGFGTPVTCDGLPHTYTVNVSPGEGITFTGGRAVASAFFSIQDFSFQQFFVSTGPTTILIRGGG
jgi:hypothetical protein